MKCSTCRLFALAFSTLLSVRSVTAQTGEQFYQWTDVSGTAIHYFDNSMLHSERPTSRGMRRYVTETVELFGDVAR